MSPTVAHRHSTATRPLGHSHPRPPLVRQPTIRATAHSHSADKMRNIVVLGGGISGLSTAYFLQKKFPNALIQIVESDHWGGWIRSVHRQDTLFETGPRTLRPHGTPGAFTLNLIQELNLEKRLLRVAKSSLAARNRFVYSQSQLQKLPSSILGILLQKPKIFNGIPMEILNEFFNKKSRRIYQVDESIQSFFERRFGKYDLTSKN